MKLKLTTTALLLLTSTLLFAQTQQKQTFSMTEYSFEWTVERVEEARLAVDKDQERTRVEIWKKYDSVYMSGKEAIAVGQKLADARKIFDEMKSKGVDATQRLETGSHIVSFSYDPKHGFSVSIRPDSEFGYRSGVFLSLAQAEAFQPHLILGQEMINHVDQTITID